MRKALEDFEVTDEIHSLNRLTRHLSSLLDALVGEVDGQWLEELRSAWWGLEYVNAKVLDAGRPLLAQEQRSVEQACDELRAMLVEY